MSQYLQTPPPQIPGAPSLPPQKKKSGCLKYGLIAAAILVVLMIIGALSSSGKGDATGKPVDATVTLEQAEANIISASDGVAYSNSEAGQDLAAIFSKLFKAASLESTDTIKESHNFITHCQLNEDSALFLVHVPKLRKFEKDSKERFCEIAWLIAHTVLADSNLPEGSKLAVGVKGMALYQNIYFGNYSTANLLEDSQGITSKSKDTSELEEFFKTPPTK